VTTTAPEATRTEVRAQARFVRTAPRKAGLVVDQIRGRTVPEARTILAFMTRDAARDVRKVLDSAVANAEANHGLVGDDLYVSAAFVGAGPVLKRWRARARGRVGRIRKRTCHITIELALPSGEAIPEPIQQAVPAAPEVEEEAPAEEQAPAEEAEAAVDEPLEAEAEAPAEEEEEAPAEEPEPAAEKKPKRASRARKKTDEKDEEKGA
jgi:large subunit ribosomal protein L22